MKVRVVLITENNVPAAKIGADGANKIKAAWEMLMRLAEVNSENGDRGHVESVEILEG